jgi:hypothetical protein
VRPCLKAMTAMLQHQDSKQRCRDARDAQAGANNYLMLGESGGYGSGEYEIGGSQFGGYESRGYESGGYESAGYESTGY